MPFSRSRSAALIGSLALAVTGLSGFVAGPAHANPAGTGLVISEVYGGGGNTGATYTNDFVELYNPTGAAISVDGWSVQYRSATGTTAQVTKLAGSVAAHSSYLVQEGAGAGGTTALPTPDATGTIAMSGTAGVVILSNGTTGISTPGNLAGAAGVVDAAGFGTTATSYEGSGPTPAPSNTNSVARTATGADTDDNAADFTAGPPTPRNSAAGGTTATITVDSIPDAYGKVGSAITPITPTASGGSGTYTWSAKGLPAGVTIDPATGVVSGTPTTSGSDKVTVTATDADSAAGSTSFFLAVGEQHSIAEIQGTDTDTSPLVGKEVDIQGVVTAVYATGGFNGFYVETGGAGGAADADTTPGASDAVYVFGADAAKQVTVGESVDVIGQVSEFKGATEIGFPSVTKLDSDLPSVVPDTLPWSDLDTDAKKEAHEGELMAPQGHFTVADDYNTNFYGEIELAAGDQILRQPTDAGAPGSQAARDAAAYNAAHVMFLDDGSSTVYGPTSSVKNSPLPWLTTDSPVSVGAQATFHQPVVLDYRNSQWNLQPQQPLVGDGSAIATFSDMRTQNALPGDVGGQVRLATFNVQNFFPTTVEQFLAENPGAHCTTYNDRAGNPITANSCSFADGSAGPRGAATDASYQRQLSKIVYGINHLGASVVSLEEIENAEKFGHDRDWAVQKLVDALDADAGSGVWAYAPSPSDADLPPLAEQDVIRTAFIYKPADVTPVGVSHVMTGYSDDGQSFSIAREPLAQGFKAAGAQASDAFMVVANHLKSKGAGTGLFNDCANGGDAENTDLLYDQGAFNCTRVHEVQDMSAWAQQQAQQLGTDRIFLVGDFNAYDHEDPMEYLYGQGFTDVAGTYDPTHSSYAYNGLEGSLDHVLASPSALRMVTGADIWQINAQESVAFDYSRYNYSATDLFDGNSPWAASDHDPEVVGLNLPKSKAPSTVSAPPARAVYSRGAPRITVTVTAPGAQPTGTVTVLDHGVPIGSATLAGGSAVVSLPAKSYKRGTYTFTVTYSGDDAVTAGSTSVTLTITNPDGV